MKRIIEVFLIFLRLGLTSFGGPIAHLAYFQDEFVNRKQWLDEKQYAEIVTLCQFLPGPASSQVGMVIGKIRAGFFGSIVAWIGFTFPSTILMILFALGVSNFPEFINSNLLHGCKLAAVVVVAQALWQMGSKLCPDRERISLTIISAALLIFFHGVWGQILVILFGAIIGKFFLKETKDPLDSSE
ncbi:MAG: chromate transporter, partial [Leptospiraceae bacterium]|nr:chromate transporter [Leptospiraceae bacterium]